MLLLLGVANAYKPQLIDQPVMVNMCHQSYSLYGQPAGNCSSTSSAKYLSLLSSDQILPFIGFSLLCAVGVVMLASLIWAELLFRPPR